MPRPARPRFHRLRRRWFACIGAFDASGRRREVFAPAFVQDEGAAWDWFRTETCRRNPAPPIAAAPAEPDAPRRPRVPPPSSAPARARPSWHFDRDARLAELLSRARLQRADLLRERAAAPSEPAAVAAQDGRLVILAARVQRLSQALRDARRRRPLTLPDRSGPSPPPSERT